MEKEFVPYELALKLKELGFDERCLAKYQKLADFANYQFQLLQKERNCNILDTAISAPLWQQAFDWFIEKYGLLGNPFPVLKDRYFFTIRYVEFDNYKQIMGSPFNPADAKLNIFDCRIACLKKLIEIVENGNRTH